MTQDQDFDRLLERWLGEGPTQMPDRLFEFVDRIDRIPQRRLARLQTRLFAMNVKFRLAAAAAVIVIVAGVGAAVLTKMPAIGVKPSPTPNAASSMTLQSKWTSVGTRPLPAFEATLPTEIVFRPTVVSITQWYGDVESAWTPLDDGKRVKVVFESTWKGLDSPRLSLRWNDCRIGDEGIYSFSFASDGRTLTLSPLSETCAQRAAIMEGEWTRWPCAATESVCYDVVTPGRHDAAVFRPFDDGRSGRFAYTVPTGWVQPYTPPSRPPFEFMGFYPLLSAAEPVSSYMTVDSMIVPNAYPVDCFDPEGNPPEPGETIAAWLATLAGLQVSGSTAINVGGLDGVYVDVSIARDWSNPCLYGTETLPDGTEVPQYGESWVRPFTSPNDFWYFLNPGERARYVILDRGDGEFLIATIHALDANWDAFVATAMPVVESFEFTR